MLINPLLCPGETPTFFIFDFFTAPHLLFYSYIPTVIVSIIIAIFVLKNDSYSLRGRMFFYFILFFVLWVLNIFVQWLASYIVVLMFFWQTLILLEVPIFIFALFFTYSFINNAEKIPASYKIPALLVYLGAAIFVPTTLVITSYDTVNCVGIYGPVWQFVFGLEILATVMIGYLCLRKYLSKKSDIPKGEMMLFGLGMIAFLSFFIFSNVYADISSNYLINFYGPIGLTIFLAILSFLMVKFKAFNAKIIGANLLFMALLAVTASILFITDISTIRIVVSASLIVMVIFGDMFINSVRREVKTKEALKIANERQEETMSLITHQIRGVFTTTKAGLSAVVDGSYGPIPQNLMDVMKHMFKSQEDGVIEVQTFLQAQKIESGTVQYDFKPFDLKTLVEELSAKEKPRADSKSLEYEVRINNEDYVIEGDRVYLTQLVDNFIDNAIRYTEKGSIKIQLSRKPDSVLYSVKDSGVGIKEEDKDKIFTKYGHGTDSRKINSDSSGLGLYIVKGIVVGHGGKIWYETEIGKGTTFFAEIPIKQITKK